MTYANIDKLFRGFAGKSTKMGERFFLGIPLEDPNVSHNLPTKSIAMFGLLGISSICLGSLADPTYLAANSYGIYITPEKTIEGLYISGGVLLGLASLNSVVFTGVATVFSCLINKDNFGLACTKMELAGKFLKIFTEPVLCILCTIAQAFYMLTCLLLTLASLVLFPVYQRLHLKDPISNFNEVGYAYFDLVNQAVFSVISLIVNAGDFLFSLKSNVVDGPENESEVSQNNQEQRPFKAFSGTSYKLSENFENFERVQVREASLLTPSFINEINRLNQEYSAPQMQFRY